MCPLCVSLLVWSSDGCRLRPGSVGTIGLLSLARLVPPLGGLWEVSILRADDSA